MLAYSVLSRIRPPSLHINKNIYTFPYHKQGFYKICRFSQLSEAIQKTENQNVFKIPKKTQIVKRKRYRFSHTSLNGFTVIPYGRREPIKDIKLLEKAMQRAMLRSTDGKNDGSKPLPLSQNPKLKLRVNIYQKTFITNLTRFYKCYIKKQVIAYRIILLQRQKISLVFSITAKGLLLS
ncbi:hypothetical protein PMAC_001324 [Pneumocystis sp. 'macacae']|nr:hypothetical protein PMAC_001324 [Pneumocystis sp. 'macacae']